MNLSFFNKRKFSDGRWTTVAYLHDIDQEIPIKQYGRHKAFELPNIFYEEFSSKGIPIPWYGIIHDAIKAVMSGDADLIYSEDDSKNSPNGIADIKYLSDPNIKVVRFYDRHIGREASRIWRNTMMNFSEANLDFIVGINSHKNPLCAAHKIGTSDVHLFETKLEAQSFCKERTEEYSSALMASKNGTREQKKQLNLYMMGWDEKQRKEFLYYIASMPCEIEVMQHITY